jgi:hypothetical protein
MQSSGQIWIGRASLGEEGAETVVIICGFALFGEVTIGLLRPRLAEDRFAYD